jgi:hypothetical protein
LDAVRTSKKATKAKRWSSILTDRTRPCLDIIKIKNKTFVNFNFLTKKIIFYLYRLKHSLIVSSVAVSGKLAIANHLDSVGFVDNDTLLVAVSLGMAKIHSIYSNENIYKLKKVNHIQTHTQ